MGSNGGRDYELSVARFEEAAHRLPPNERLAFAVWLLQWIRRPGRVFRELDPVTGKWRRLP